MPWIIKRIKWGIGEHDDEKGGAPRLKVLHMMFDIVNKYSD
jgi:hypothetical protein